MRAYLYDADGVDGELELEALSHETLGSAQLLWVDLDGADRDGLENAARFLQLDPETVSTLARGSTRPLALVHQEYFHVAVGEVQEDAEGYRSVVLDCVAGLNWVLTSHHEPLVFPKSFHRRFRGDSNVGRFDSATFVATLLNEQLLTYTRQIGPLIERVGTVEQLVLSARIDEERLLRQLVGIAQRITQLRRLLAPHLEVYEQLAQPNFARLLPDASSDGLFEGLVGRLERALDSLDATHQLVAGSFDLYATLVAHGTNQVIKLLTVVSLTLLPVTFLTGVLGMDALPHALRTMTAFWVSLAVMSVLIATTLTLARRRKWI